MSTLAVKYIVLIFLLVRINLEIHCTSISCPFEHRKPCSVLLEQSRSVCCIIYTCSLLFVSRMVQAWLWCHLDNGQSLYMLCINTSVFLVVFFSRQLRSSEVACFGESSFGLLTLCHGLTGIKSFSVFLGFYISWALLFVFSVAFDNFSNKLFVYTLQHVPYSRCF